MSHGPGWKFPLEDGLTMRGATPADADPLAEFNALVHGEDSPATWIGEWTRDLLSLPHPGLSPDDVIIVEVSATGRIVSSTVYFHQSWSYGGISVPFGRPELVATHPEYRNRGLVRRQFELMHRWGDERGHMVQCISGIPYYYRQFGYEQALESALFRSATLNSLPETPAAITRPATGADLPAIAALREQAKERSLIAPDPTLEDLEYQLFARSEPSAVHRWPRIIEDPAGNMAGFFTFKAVASHGEAEVPAIEFVNPAACRDLIKPLIAGLKQECAGISGANGESVENLTFRLPRNHPLQPFLGRSFSSASRRGAWYMRVPDLPSLLMRIAPALEERLQGTIFEGLSGRRLISFYRSGIWFEFESGRLKGVERETMPQLRAATAALPDLTFLQLLFGRKSMAELVDMFTDARVKGDEEIAFMDTMFPVTPSDAMFAVS